MTHEDPLDESAVPRLGLSPGAIMAILVGGALGTMARYLLEATYGTAPGHFPATTLLINLSGCLAIGFLVQVTATLPPRLALVRPLVVVGLLGGWTTYSTLAVDAVLLAKGDRVGWGLAYLAASLIGGLALVALGDAAARRMVPR